MSPAVTNLFYLAAAVLFILGLKGLGHPRTAVRGNLLGALGMLIAVVVTLLDRSILSYTTIIIGLVVGGGLGALIAMTVKMTAMPQLVAIFNGFGGGASVLVAGAALFEATGRGGAPTSQFTISVAASGIIGAVTFFGSLVAFLKLQEVLKRNLHFPGVQALNALLLLGALGLGAAVAWQPAHPWFYWAMVGVASVLGLMLVMPIGGADMPVVIALLNSYSGLAAAATGFVLNNNGLIIAGSLVGASGVILTSIMCRAMNRSLLNVLVGGLQGAAAEGPSADEVYAGKVKATGPEEVALLFDSARKVVVVPGYGLAVAQAQHVVRDLANRLEARGIEVSFAIHPVAGRMPGHMNVLLAEANVAYDKLQDLEEANSGFEQTDVVLVIGANDVVNPDARENPGSPIAGMPILEVDRARTVVVIKRSLSPGFAGIPNPLFALDKTLMLFGDGKKALLELVAAVKETA